MAQNKLLLPWTDGKPIVRRVVSAYFEAKIEKLVVVTGRDADDVEACLAGLPLTLAHNPDYATGEMLSSVKVGLGALAGDLAGAFIQPGDMPCISAGVVAKLLAAHERGRTVAPVYRGQRGHPVLLDRADWRGMLAVKAGGKPRDGLGEVKLVGVEDAGVVVDVDTREAYERVMRGCWGALRGRTKSRETKDSTNISYCATMPHN